MILNFLIFLKSKSFRLNIQILRLNYYASKYSYHASILVFSIILALTEISERSDFFLWKLLSHQTTADVFILHQFLNCCKALEHIWPTPAVKDQEPHFLPCYSIEPYHTQKIHKGTGHTRT